MNHPRFYLPDSLQVPEVALTGLEAHHLSNVLRLKPGEMVALFDGTGNEAVARIEEVRKKRVRLSILSHHSGIKELPRPLTLATAVPKGERFRWLVEKATELGASRLVPLRTARSVVNPRESKLEKMQAAVIAACKQSGRSRLMQLSPPQDWEEFLKRESAAARLIIAHPGGDPWSDALVADAEQVMLCVGPEGGFADEEIALAQPTAKLVSLGPRILRIETAALALVSLAATAIATREQ